MKAKEGEQGPTPARLPPSANPRPTAVAGHGAETAGLCKNEKHAGTMRPQGLKGNIRARSKRKDFKGFWLEISGGQGRAQKKKSPVSGNKQGWTICSCPVILPICHRRFACPNPCQSDQNTAHGLSFWPVRLSSGPILGVIWGMSAKFKLSLWRPFEPGTALIVAASDTATEEAPSTFRELSPEIAGIQREVFGWRMLEDAFGGVVDEAERNKLKAALFDALDMGVDPKKRSISALRSFVEEATRVLGAGTVEWTGSQSAVPDEEEEERRLNPLLALVNYLTWLIDVFDEQPNISVTIR